MQNGIFTPTPPLPSPNAKILATSYCDSQLKEGSLTSESGNFAMDSTHILLQYYMNTTNVGQNHKVCFFTKGLPNQEAYEV